MSVNFKMQVKPCATRVPNFNSLSSQTNYLWQKEENLLIQIVSRFGIKSLSEVKYAWQQLLDQLMDFKSLNVEQQGNTSATNGPKFNWVISANESSIVEGTRLAPYNSIKNWD